MVAGTVALPARAASASAAFQGGDILGDLFGGLFGNRNDRDRSGNGSDTTTRGRSRDLRATIRTDRTEYVRTAPSPSR
jgi:hypothetical protein